MDPQTTKSIYRYCYGPSTNYIIVPVRNLSSCCIVCRPVCDVFGMFLCPLTFLQIIHTDSNTVLGQNDTGFSCDGSANTFRVMFKEPVEILPNVNYTACATLKVRYMMKRCDKNDAKYDTTFEITAAPDEFGLLAFNSTSSLKKGSCL